jgi:uroporphyrinogen decarboxylase
VGSLGPDDYRDYVMPHVAKILSRVGAKGVPVIHFGTGTATLLELQREAGGSVIGVDWRTPLDQARARLPGVAVQGNLDPMLLFAPREVLAARVARVVEQAGSAPGHIFNLGHGITPETSVDAVKFVADHVHALTAR